MITVKTNKTIILSILLVILLTVPACGQAVSQQGQDILIKELNAIQGEVSAAEDELNTTRSELTMTQKELSIVQGKLDTTEGELSATRSELIDAENEIVFLQGKLSDADIIKAQYKEKLAECEASKEEYEVIIEETVTDINEAEVELAVFDLVNQERKDNGFNALVWDDGLYSCAKSNNLKMAETKRLENPECPSFFQVFWFLGYGTTEQIAETTLTIWKDNIYGYKQNILSNAVYGAVSANQSEGILYITYVAYVNLD